MSSEKEDNAKEVSYDDFEKKRREKMVRKCAKICLQKMRSKQALETSQNENFIILSQKIRK